MKKQKIYYYNTEYKFYEQDNWCYGRIRKILKPVPIQLASIKLTYFDRCITVNTVKDYEQFDYFSITDTRDVKEIFTKDALKDCELINAIPNNI